MLESIENSGYGILILGTIGSIIGIVLVKILTAVTHKESHEVHVFKLLFNKSNSKRDETDHTYLMIVSCAYTLGMLMLTCTSVMTFLVIRINVSQAFYSLVAVFIATVMCLYGVIKGIDSINELLDIHLQQKDPVSGASAKEA